MRTATSVSLGFFSPIRPFKAERACSGSNAKNIILSLSLLLGYVSRTHFRSIFLSTKAPWLKHSQLYFQIAYFPLRLLNRTKRTSLSGDILHSDPPSSRIGDKSSLKSIVPDIWVKVHSLPQLATQL